VVETAVPLAEPDEPAEPAAPIAPAAEWPPPPLASR
jgi:hypothetical protein